jgi:hypothetical protein
MRITRTARGICKRPAATMLLQTWKTPERIDSDYEVQVV